MKSFKFLGFPHRKTVSKIYPAMYIENVTELAFDDVTPEDPDFPCIQGMDLNNLTINWNAN